METGERGSWSCALAVTKRVQAVLEPSLCASCFCRKHACESEVIATRIKVHGEKESSCGVEPQQLGHPLLEACLNQDHALGEAAEDPCMYVNCSIPQR